MASTSDIKNGLCIKFIGLLVVMTALIYFVPTIKNYLKEYLNKSSLKMVMWVALSWIILVAAIKVVEQQEEPG